MGAGNMTFGRDGGKVDGCRRGSVYGARFKEGVSGRGHAGRRGRAGLPLRETLLLFSPFFLSLWVPPLPRGRGGSLSRARAEPPGLMGGAAAAGREDHWKRGLFYLPSLSIAGSGPGDVIGSPGPRPLPPVCLGEKGRDSTEGGVTEGVSLFPQRLSEKGQK